MSAAASTPDTGDAIVGVDLFAGAGGASTGFEAALIDEYRGRIAAETGLDPSEVDAGHVRVQVWLETHVELHAINHWEPAITTHEQNHPWATHHHARIEELYPPDVVEPGTVDFLIAGPECTHFSNARGGKPVSDQRRASAWHVLDWIEKLQPDVVLVENVKEFRQWGPIEEGEPSRDGTIYERWIGMLEALGYSVVTDDEGEHGVVLNAADYGDPQSRERLFIMASRESLPTPPEATHSDDAPGKPDRRPASDVIDWTDLGTSLWTRDLEHPRVQPLAESTMGRIAEGIRRHCSSRLGPFADVLASIGRDELESLREAVVPARYADVVAGAVDDPFLVRVPSGPTALSAPSVVKYYGTSSVTAVDQPLDTVTADGNHHAVSLPSAYVLGQHSNSIARDVDDRSLPTVASGGKIQLCTPETFCLRQQSGGVPVPVADAPLSTVASGGAIGLATVEEKRLVQPKNGQYGGEHSNLAYDPYREQHHTVTTDPRQGHVLTPALVRYSHGGAALSVDDPMPTVATEKGGTFALSQPYLCPMYNSRSGQRPRTRRVDRPLMTVPASKGSPSGLAVPFLEDFQGPPKTVGRPLNTQHGNDRYALVVPELWPWGIDIRYRMLKPDELKQAQGFPAGYEIAGSSKKTVTAQIGNAVPVNLARALVRQLLVDDTPSLSTFGGGIQPDPDVDIPSYGEVAESDD